MQDIVNRYREVRKRTEDICAPLKTEDYVVQPVADVSPPKWHLGHTAWFFETFLLKPAVATYSEFNPDFNYVFNSYYETVGARVIRTDRGNLSRPAVDEVYAYRKHVDAAMIELLQSGLSPELIGLVELGFNHEEQHQELLYTDIKYILGHNPLMPVYKNNFGAGLSPSAGEDEFARMNEGIYEIGYSGDDFHFDNEEGRHKVYLHEYSICKAPVSNASFMEFMNDGGYEDFRFWHAEGWEWVNSNQIRSPLYWHFLDGTWMNYTFAGLREVDPAEPVCHISYYEAAAYAAWKNCRLPTEFEWEAASHLFDYGRRWEWTNSAYLPYPGFVRSAGAIGEYNGKFMVNQMVLRGSSDVTPPRHSRPSYRNFFHAPLRWQFTGMRLAK